MRGLIHRKVSPIRTYCIQCDVVIGGIAEPGQPCPLRPEHVLVDYEEVMQTMAELYTPSSFLVRGMRIFK